jgi:sugar phosphate isomerase/epimerase
MKKGVQLFTVRNYMKDKAQLEASLKKIKAMGYDSVQNGTPHFMTDAEMKSLLGDIGLTPCSAYSGFDEMKLRDYSMSESLDAIKRAIATAKIYETKYIGVGTLPEHMRESLDGYKQFAADMNKIGAELKKEGCGLIYHSHALEFFSLGGGKHGMDILFDETDPESIFFSHDTHWLTAGGVNPVDWIYKSKGRMPIIHFKDYAIIGGAQTIETVCKRFAEVGEGNIDWAGVVKACHDTGVEYAIVEQDTCPGNPFDSLEISCKNMIKFGV